MASIGEVHAGGPEGADAHAAALSLSNPPGHNENRTQLGSDPSLGTAPASSKPVEMSNLAIPATIFSGSTSSSSGAMVKAETEKENVRPEAESSPPPPASSPLASISPSSEPLPSHPSLPHEHTEPAIEPASDKPTPTPTHVVSTGPQLIITLLLHTGARHPYRIDERYLKKRDVNVANNNPVNMSVYTLKELIWRDWREEWEPRPSSPSSIRLIHYGKMLDDKAHLKDGRFTIGDIPHVVHMTVKPQDVVDDEDARIAKSGGRDRDGSERSSGCRCVIL